MCIFGKRRGKNAPKNIGKIVLLGAAGAGKGSLARCLAAEYGIPHISTGEIFRKHIKEGTHLGKIAEKYISVGNLVPDDIVVDVVRARLLEPDCAHGFLLDGFPRTAVQADRLSKHIKIDRVIQLSVSAETVLKRLGGRYMCRKCGAHHNALWDDISKCKVCGGELYQREDDRADIIQKRYEQYNADASAILATYARLNTPVLKIESLLTDSPENMYRKFKEKYGKIFG